MAIGNLLQAVIGPIIAPLINRIPDKNERERAKEELESQMLVAMTSLVEGQLQANIQQAQHGSIFVAGARPAIMWICGAALGWNYILQPILNWFMFASGIDITAAPQLETGELTTILLGMLGLGGMRSYEKRFNVARNDIKRQK